MADHTLIEWTDATWNPITGCSVVSPGCKNCYAMKLAGTRLRHLSSRAGLTAPSKAGPVWNGQVRLIDEKLTEPLRWRRPRRIFVCPHGDLFHESVPDAWIDRVFAVMALAPHHTFQVLTKRSARMRPYLAGFSSESNARARLWQAARDLNWFIDTPGDGAYLPNVWAGWPLRNCWLGVSAEDQRRAEERVPDLLATPAAIRFVSAEPLFGPIDFTALLIDENYTLDALRGHYEGITPQAAPFLPESALDWIIVGGESGPGARPMHPAWARQIRDACAETGVAYLFKQWGSWAPFATTAIYESGRIGGDCCGPGPIIYAGRKAGQHPQVTLRGGPTVRAEVREEPTHRWGPNNDLRMTYIRVGKKAAGRLLDGVEHNGFPEARL